ncbi:MAG TPA: hypothetical protein VMF06_10495 [Candidatus Limnocylindria bacterium]|nr:hypothetical protein [Candidatus Limnocylindria bacterium]
MLAALMFLAIVIPVAVEGLRVASGAGEVGQRKSEASRVADRVLNEAIVTTNWNQAMQSGTAYESGHEYRWTVRKEQWQVDAMQTLTAEVKFLAQGRDFAFRSSTLVNPQQ